MPFSQFIFKRVFCFASLIFLLLKCHILITLSTAILQNYESFRIKSDMFYVLSPQKCLELRFEDALCFLRLTLTTSAFSYFRKSENCQNCFTLNVTGPEFHPPPPLYPLFDGPLKQNLVASKYVTNSIKNAQ